MKAKSEARLTTQRTKTPESVSEDMEGRRWKGYEPDGGVGTQTSRHIPFYLVLFVVWNFEHVGLHHALL